ncbi:hypothetical protein BDV12DRAFT_162751 [Aspergillus spectabilis]
MPQQTPTPNPDSQISNSPEHSRLILFPPPLAHSLSHSVVSPIITWKLRPRLSTRQIMPWTSSILSRGNDEVNG